MDPILDTLQLKILVAERSTLGREWNDFHAPKPYDRLYCVESGEGAIEHRGRRFTLRPGALYVIPAQSALQCICPRQVVIRWTHFISSVLGGVNLFEYLQCDCEVIPDEPSRAMELFARLSAVHGSGGPGEHLEARGLLLQAIAPFMGTIDHDRQRLRSREEMLRFREVLGFVEENLGAELSVARLAHIVHLEPRYFSTLFRKCFGISPLQHIIRRRVDRAQRMLLKGDRTLDDIAAQLNFTDGFHLSKVFKRVTGMPPREFKAKARFTAP